MELEGQAGKGYTEAQETAKIGLDRRRGQGLESDAGK